MPMFEEKIRNADLETLNSIMKDLKSWEDALYRYEAIHLPFTIIIDPEVIVDGFSDFWNSAKRKYGNIRKTISENFQKFGSQDGSQKRFYGSLREQPLLYKLPIDGPKGVPINE
ncbi:hypothetical protein B9Z55_001412 [Caenorhabditis nigoni]|nr:hypothetical protein B9Z55_001412 [Caenorhabditis nigoni]